MSQSFVPVGFVGTGRMATALAGAMVRSGVVSAEQVLGYDPSDAAGRTFAQGVGASLAASNRQLVQRSRTVVLAVKPQHLEAAAAEIAPELTDQHLVVSIVAGVSLARLYELLGRQSRLVRVMPNTPCLIGKGASAFCPGKNCLPEDIDWVQRLLGTAGFCTRVSEDLMDAVTGLSGSGPAYVFLVIEALSDAGVLLGLPRRLATQLAAHTVAGAAQMVLETDAHPALLKEQVTSPGGTTIAGLRQLELHGLRAALMAAVEAATWRSRELGQSHLLEPEKDEPAT